MLRRLTICLFLAWPVLVWPLTAQAGSTLAPDIRQVQTDSTDVFEVLSTLKQAETALANRDYVRARRGFESVLMHDSNLTAARTGLRRALISTNEIKAAYPLMEDMNAADSVIIRIRSGEVKAPLDLLSATLKETADPRLWTLMGHIHDADEAYALARQSYAMAGLAGARPGLAENNIGHSHWLADEHELALEAFTKAAALDTTDKQFDNNRRRVLVHLGKTQDAIAGLEAERAGVFLDKAADKAVRDNEIKLAKWLYRKSLDIAPRHNPQTAEKLARLDQ